MKAPNLAAVYFEATVVVGELKQKWNRRGSMLGINETAVL